MAEARAGYMARAPSLFGSSGRSRCADVHQTARRGHSCSATPAHGTSVPSRPAAARRSDDGPENSCPKSSHGPVQLKSALR